MTIPIVLVLGLLAFGIVRWGKQKVSGIIVGVLFGLALATTTLGPPLLHGVTSIGQSVTSGVSSIFK